VKKGQEKIKLKPGMIFGRLKVLTVDGPKSITIVCECGKQKITNKYDLLYGRTISCGCYRIEEATRRIIEYSYVHGASNTHEHKHWLQMVRRCTDPKFSMFKKYGARGIRVHPRWIGANGFVRFLKHVKKAPSHRHTLDRIKNEGDYVPKNVRWATSVEQGRNKSNNRMLTALGKTQCLAAWAEEMKIHPTTIAFRLKRGLCQEEAVLLPKLAIRSFS
jgi:hypothetical protein